MPKHAVFHLAFSILLLTGIITTITSSFAVDIATSTQTRLQRVAGRNITLTFEDLPTSKNGFHNISSYHHLDFSSFRLVNTTAAVNEGHLAKKDRRCATSGSNAVIAHRARTPSLWPRIALDPLAYVLPGEAPFFSLHGLSLKPMEHPSNSAVCIFITVYGLDADKTVRAWDTLAACYGPKSKGNHLNISQFFPGWGKAVNMVEFYAQAVIDNNSELEWVDWPFCIDDVEIERFGGNGWEWPQQDLPDIIPLLPPLAPFKYPDQGTGEKDIDDYSPLSAEARDRFDMWRAEGMKTTFLSTGRTGI